MNVLVLVLAATLSLNPVRADNPDQVLRDLNAPSPRVRQLAAEAAGKQKLAAAAPLLGELLRDKDEAVQAAAADALARLGVKAVPALTKALKGEEVIPKCLALTALARLGPDAEGAVEALGTALKDKDTDVRILAADALGKIGSGAKAALPALFVAAKDVANLGPRVRPQLPSGVADAAVGAALKIDPTCGPKLAEAALPDLIGALKSKDEGTVRTAADAIRGLGKHARSALPALEEAWKTETGFARPAASDAIVAITGDSTKLKLDVIADPKTPIDERLQAVESLSWARPADKAGTALRGLLAHPEAKVRAAAVAALAGHDSATQALPDLLKLLGDADVLTADPGDESAGRLPDVLARIGTEAVPALTGVVKDEKRSAVARFQAAQALGLMGRRAKAARPELERALGDRYALVAIESAFAFVQTGGDVDKALPAFRAGLKHPQPAIIRLTARSIGRTGARAKDIVPDLTPLLAHRDMEVRIAAARALSAIGPGAKGAAKSIGTLLKSENAREQYQAAEALAKLGTDARDALPALIDALKAPDVARPSSHPVHRALQNLGPLAKDAVPVLVEQLKTADDFYAGSVIETLGRIGGGAKPAVPQIVSYLTNKSSHRRGDAARALGGIGPEAKGAVPALEKLLTDESKAARAWGAYALARVTGDKKYVSALIELWEGDVPDPFGSVVFDLVQALALLGPDARPARDLLLAAVADDNTPAGTRRYAAEALGHLRGDAAVIVPKMIALLERPGKGFAWEERWRAGAEVLGALGANAKDAVPLLRKFADGEDNAIADIAARALERITGKD